MEAAVAAVGPVVIPVAAASTPVTTGTAQKLATETAVATSAINAQTVALERQGVAATDSAISQSALAAAEKKAAASHAAATRGLAAETLALTGLRGATLAASAPFLIGATSAIIFGKAIKEASDETEELNKTAVVFGESAEEIQKFAETTATSLGISSTEALKAAGVFGNLFRTIHIAEPVAADMSTRLVTLAADLASFNNADPSRTLDALRSGLVGQARPLRVFGIFLSAARVQQEALIETQKKSIKELTQAELVQARFNLILRDSNLAQGDFARTSDRLANQARILKAQLANLEAELGNKLIPTLTFAIQLANDYVDAFSKANTATSAFARNLPLIGGAAEKAHSRLGGLVIDAVKLHARMVLLGPVIGAATLAINRFGGSSEDATKKVSGFHFALGGLQAEIAAMQATAGKVDFTNITNQLKGLEVAQLKIQTGLAPGGRAAEQANLRQQIEEDKKAVAQAKSGSAARKQALQDLRADQNELDALEAQDAADQKERADAAAQAAKDAQDRAEKIKAAAAAQRKAALEAAKAQADANAAKAQALKERKQALIDARQAHLEALLSIAETTASTKDDTAAEKALKKFDQVQIRRILAIKRRRRLTLEEAAQLDAYRVDLAQRNAALKDVNEEAKNTNNKMKELMFTFLQTQQGFASNLLGNLIPGFATAGLVGGSTPQAGQPMLAGPEDRASALSNVATAKNIGVRPVQVDTTNALLRQILAALRGRHTQPPEAAFNRRAGSAMFDTL